MGRVIPSSKLVMGTTARQVLVTTAAARAAGMKQDDFDARLQVRVPVRWC